MNIYPKNLNSYNEYLFISNKEVITMPDMDGTGPRGKGPKTGRGLGECEESGQEMFGRGFGRGRGFRCWQARNKGFRPVQRQPEQKQEEEDNQ